MCNEPSTLRCSGCSSLWYCSKACQKGDWPLHKLLCSQMKTMELDTRPDASFRRAIFLSDSAVAPVIKFVWVKVEEVDATLERPVLKEWFSKSTTTGTFNYNHLRKRWLPGVLDIRHGDNYSWDGSLPNQGVMAATKGRPAHEWNGPLVVLRNKKTDRLNGMDPGLYTDVEIGDLRNIADYFAYCADYQYPYWLVPNNEDPEKWLTEEH